MTCWTWLPISDQLRPCTTSTNTAYDSAFFAGKYGEATHERSTIPTRQHWPRLTLDKQNMVEKVFLECRWYSCWSTHVDCLGNTCKIELYWCLYVFRVQRNSWLVTLAATLYPGTVLETSYVLRTIWNWVDVLNQIFPSLFGITLASGG